MWAPLVAVVAAGVVFVGACTGDGRVGTDVVGGDPDRGRELAATTGCAECHRIPGVQGADGRVAPPLDGFRHRTHIAGEVANQPEQLVRWLLDPQDVRPGTAMPNVGLDEQQARDVAAYLRTLG